jgi:hypothetical protein
MLLQGNDEVFGYFFRFKNQSNTIQQIDVIFKMQQFSWWLGSQDYCSLWLQWPMMMIRTGFASSKSRKKSKYLQFFNLF